MEDEVAILLPTLSSAREAKDSKCHGDAGIPCASDGCRGCSDSSQADQRVGGDNGDCTGDNGHSSDYCHSNESICSRHFHADQSKKRVLTAHQNSNVEAMMPGPTGALGNRDATDDRSPALSKELDGAATPPSPCAGEGVGASATAATAAREGDNDLAVPHSAHTSCQDGEACPAEPGTKEQSGQQEGSNSEADADADADADDDDGPVAIPPRALSDARSASGSRWNRWLSILDEREAMFPEAEIHMVPIPVPSKYLPYVLNVQVPMAPAPWRRSSLLLLYVMWVPFVGAPPS